MSRVLYHGSQVRRQFPERRQCSTREQVRRTGVLLGFGKRTHAHHGQRNPSKEAVVELDFLEPEEWMGWEVTDVYSMHDGLWLKVCKIFVSPLETFCNILQTKYSATWEAEAGQLLDSRSLGLAWATKQDYNPNLRRSSTFLRNVFFLFQSHLFPYKPFPIRSM